MAPTPVRALLVRAVPKVVGMSDAGGWEPHVDRDGAVAAPPEPAVPYRRPRRPPRPGRPGTGLAHQARPVVLATIAAGGALGAAARYGVAQLVGAAGPGGFPWATFWTNVSGSLALGVILTLVLERFPPSRYLRPFSATGFLGAFTTYSTFAVETDLLVGHGHTAIALAYVIGSVAAGYLAVWGGMLLARAMPHGVHRRRRPPLRRGGRP